MKPAAFAYAKARSLRDAITLLGKHKKGARLLAGGQSLIAALNMRLDAPSVLIDINGIEGLDEIHLKKGWVEIGALVRHSQALHSPIIAKHVPLIAKALPHIAHPAIRNRGTIGGSIALADPAAELPACLVALGGEAVITGPKGKRTVKADNFFKDLFETALGPRDVLTAIRVPVASSESRFGFAEICRRRGDYAIVGLATSARVKDKELSDIRLVYFGIGSKPERARKAEAALVKGKIDAAVAALDDDLDPHDDVQATGATRRYLAGVLLKRIARELAEVRL
ncbi:MAG: xanthine dehydrogenase family protein subunit M [Xanthobacteraceae bacterium]|nr:xanthine dehydrogenase family protein subunit M [Xanthobacteraceae bacterium]